MRGMIEIKEDTYDDAIEHLKRIKAIACKMIKALDQYSDIYDDEQEDRRRSRNRYDYRRVYP